ncbi:MAG: hypothetical protein RIT14_2060 [Pseudomonadota bacterium]
MVRLSADIRPSRPRAALRILDLVFHGAVHNVRKSHTSAVIGLLLNVGQTVALVVTFYLLFAFSGARPHAIRGDYILFLMSGIFMYITHVKAIGAVIRAEGPTSALMKHAPMNTLIAIGAAALGTLYVQVFSAAIVLYFYHAMVTPLTIDQPVGSVAMLILSWASGAAIGMVFRAAMPWQPRLVGAASSVYMRLNMIASGKMFVANATPTAVLAFFDWNPLFHTIDQVRGFLFLNYQPRYSSIDYPVGILIACLTLGLMGEFYTRKRVSLSWSMGQ